MCGLLASWHIMYENLHSVHTNLLAIHTYTPPLYIAAAAADGEPGILAIIKPMPGVDEAVILCRIRRGSRTIKEKSGSYSPGRLGGRA